ncbi:MAG: hypothetical protein A2017_07110 [Lentisphaerae bacterium GWF2_44_16]|nr:MAG: hypothetical protein A2017_07110 [Lentisphaerae bacterium GWF2_44_16]
MLWTIQRQFESDPFYQMRGLQREMNRLFDNTVTGGSFPAVNVWSNEENIILCAEIPGLEEKDINITVLDDKLTLEGEKKAEPLKDDTVCLRKERGEGKFARSFKLPYNVDSEKVSAKYQSGVLTVTLPRSETSKPKKIAVSAQ